MCHLVDDVQGARDHRDWRVSGVWCHRCSQSKCNLCTATWLLTFCKCNSTSVGHPLYRSGTFKVLRNIQSTIGWPSDVVTTGQCLTGMASLPFCYCPQVTLPVVLRQLSQGSIPSLSRAFFLRAAVLFVSVGVMMAMRLRVMKALPVFMT